MVPNQVKQAPSMHCSAEEQRKFSQELWKATETGADGELSEGGSESGVDLEGKS